MVDLLQRYAPAVALVAAAAVGLVLVLHHFRFFAYHRHKGRTPPHGFWWSLRHEAEAYAILGWWHVRALLRDGLRTPPVVRGRPVVFVHGYSQDATNWHGQRRMLEAAGRPTVAISMIPAGFTPLRWYARMLERWLRRLTARSPDGFDVVAHSMGGIVLRMVLAEHPELRPALRTVVTLGTPHRGTAAARGIPVWPEAVALKRSSRLIGALPDLAELVPEGRVVAIAGEMDTIVYPYESAFAPGAEHVLLPGVGHAGLLTHRSALDAVATAVLDPEIGGRRASP